MVLKALKISLHATSALQFALQWTCAWCLIYKLLCWTCSLTQVQTWVMTLRTIRLTTYSFNTVCILSFSLIIHYLLYLYFIYNIIVCCIAFAMVIWWLVGGFCTYGVKHLRNILAQRWLLQTCKRKSKYPSQISKFILVLSAFHTCGSSRCSCSDAKHNQPAEFLQNVILYQYENSFILLLIFQLEWNTLVSVALQVL